MVGNTGQGGGIFRRKGQQRVGRGRWRRVGGEGAPEDRPEWSTSQPGKGGWPGRPPV